MSNSYNEYIKRVLSESINKNMTFLKEVQTIGLEIDFDEFELEFEGISILGTKTKDNKLNLLVVDYCEEFNIRNKDFFEKITKELRRLPKSSIEECKRRYKYNANIQNLSILLFEVDNQIEITYITNLQYEISNDAFKFIDIQLLEKMYTKNLYNANSAIIENSTIENTKNECFEKVSDQSIKQIVNSNQPIQIGMQLTNVKIDNLEILTDEIKKIKNVDLRIFCEERVEGFISQSSISAYQHAFLELYAIVEEVLTIYVQEGTVREKLNILYDEGYFHENMYYELVKVNKVRNRINHGGLQYIVYASEYNDLILSTARLLGYGQM